MTVTPAPGRATPPLVLPAALLALPLFSASDAVRHGIDHRALSAAVDAGAVERVQRGWYSSGTVTVDERYRQRAEIVRRRYGLPLTGLSALVHHGLPAWDLEVEPVHLAGPVPRTRPGVRVHRPLPGTPDQDDAVGVLDAVLVAALDDPARALAAADAAARRGDLDPRALSASLGRLDGRAGARAARAALTLVDPRRESVGESRLALLCHGWGMVVEPQLRVVLDDGVAFADFRVAGTRVLLEFDGRLKYIDPDAVYREKRREDALRERGWTVVRVVWSDLYRPDELHRRITAAIARTGRHG